MYLTVLLLKVEKHTNVTLENFCRKNWQGKVEEVRFLTNDKYAIFWNTLHKLLSLWTRNTNC